MKKKAMHLDAIIKAVPSSSGMVPTYSAFFNFRNNEGKEIKRLTDHRVRKYLKWWIERNLYTPVKEIKRRYISSTMTAILDDGQEVKFILMREKGYVFDASTAVKKDPRKGLPLPSLETAEVAICRRPTATMLMNLNYLTKPEI